MNEKEKENQGDKTAEDKNHKNTSKTSKPETKHQITLGKFRGQKNRTQIQRRRTNRKLKQLKEDDTEKNIETRSQMNKQKEIALRKNDERERNSGKTKPQNIKENSEKEVCMGCNKYVETGVQYGSCYR